MKLCAPDRLAKPSEKNDREIPLAMWLTGAMFIVKHPKKNSPTLRLHVETAPESELGSARTIKRTSPETDSQRHQRINRIIESVREQFPFENYVRTNSGVYQSIASTVMKWLPPPAKILDFGAGPCDKTAVLARLGYQCVACDDLEDDWHLKGRNREKIVTFANESGIRFVLMDHQRNLPYEDGEFDLVMLNDVLEHLHDSPRELLTMLLKKVKPGGFLLVSVPNAVNLHKRLKVLMGLSNLPDFQCYYWYPGKWRGHVREYTKDDLEQICIFLNLKVRELRSANHALHAVPGYLRPFWKALTFLIKSGRDSWILVGTKPLGWSPRDLSQSELNEIMGRFTPYKY